MPNRIKDFTTLAVLPAADDYGIVDGLANATRRLPALARLSARNALAPAGGIAFDGSGGQVNAPILALNADAFTTVVGLSIPSANPSQTNGLWGINISKGGANETDFHVVLETDGTLRVGVFPTGFSDRHELTVVNAITLYGAKRIALAVVRNGTTVTIYINGLPVGAETHAAWATSLPGTYFALGTNWGSNFAGTIHFATLYNLALSAADVLEIFELGGNVPERFRWGSQSPLNTNNWGNNGVYTSFASPDAISFSASTASGVGLVSANPRFTGRVGQSYRIRGTATLNSGAQPAAQFWDNISSRSNAIAISSGAFSAVLTLTTDSNSNGQIAFLTSGATDYSVVGLVGTRLGAVLHLPLHDGLGFQLQDVSANRLHAVVSATGATHVAPVSGPASLRATTSTAGDQPVLGSVALPAVALPANAQLLRVRARAQSGTPTVMLGTASGGAQVVAAVSLTTAWKNLTLVPPDGLLGASAVTLWVNSTTAAVIEWHLEWEPLSA